MATVSFANLAETLEFNQVSLTNYASTTSQTGSLFAFDTLGLDTWQVGGNGFAYTGGLPTGGTVTSLSLDVDGNEGAGADDLTISGLSVAATDFAFDGGSSTEQNANFWRAALSGNDAFDFTLGDYSSRLRVSGDGTFLLSGTHVGGNDSFNAGADPLTGFSRVFGDFGEVRAGATATGGDDSFTVGAYLYAGDFDIVRDGAIATGGDDIFTPLEIANTDNGANLIFIIGDVVVAEGQTTGGDDLIDLSGTDVSTLTQQTHLIGDAFAVDAGVAFVGGDDTIIGSALGDIIYGDVEVGGGAGGDDLLIGGGGDDLIIATGGDDTLEGEAGNDSLFGGFGKDRTEGGGGDDFIRTGPDNDTLLGGSGNDTLGASNRTDLLRGGAGQDLLLGSNGNDRLFGDGQSDTLLGGNGRDTIEGGAGADRLVGGDQVDTASYANAGAGVQVRLWNGDGTAGDAAGDVLIDMENVLGSAFGDTLAGDDAANRLEGGEGDDIITALGGNDQIIGGDGGDVMTGGAGNDTFIFNSVHTGDDSITDFVAGAGSDDAVRLLGFGAAFNTLAEVKAAATQVGADTVIDFGGGISLTLEGVNLNALHADDFIFG